MNPPPTVWDDVLRRLQTELPAFALEAWIHPLAVREQAGRLLLLAPSPFHGDRVRSRFLGQIARCAEESAGRPIAVSIELLSEAAAAACNEPGTDRAAAGVELDADAATRTQPQPRPLKLAPVRPARPAAPGTAPRRLDPPSVRVREAATAERAPANACNAPRQLALPHRFETFVVGPANALAREASLAVAHHRQTGLSPLFLMGPTGTGKSHLAQALVAEAREQGRSGAVYSSAEDFTNHLTRSIRNRSTEGFRRRFRDECRLLVLEDVQFLEGKPATQLELFNIVEHLQLVGGGVVLTGDRLPREIPRFDARLASQMASGLVAEMDLPDEALRRSILRDKAARGGVHLPAACLDLLVASVRGSVRDVEGVLIQLVASASLLGRAVDLSLTEAALRKIAPICQESLTIDDVIDCVGAFFGVSREQLASPSRRKSVLRPRQLAMYLCRRYTDASLSEIGRRLGRDHPAVGNAVRSVERGILERAPLRYQVEELAGRLEGHGGSAQSQH